MGSSTLDPAGAAAAETATLFWWMTSGCLVVWLLAVGVALFRARGRRRERPQRLVAGFVAFGGVIVPGLLLAVLVFFGLQPLTRVEAAASEGVTISVTGEQRWWRVRYTRPDGTAVDLANEVRVPLGRPTEVLLATDNGPHAFWIPALAGTVDMVPGRRTRVVLEPRATGVFRGACAGQCGESQALMDLRVEVMEVAAFDAWLAGEAAAATPPATNEARRGAELFTWHGCGACHTVRGTLARGVIGPDLTHIASRPSLALASMRTAPPEALSWPGEPSQIEPDVHLPRFEMVGAAALRALAAYLAELR